MRTVESEHASRMNTISVQLLLLLFIVRVHPPPTSNHRFLHITLLHRGLLSVMVWACLSSAFKQAQDTPFWKLGVTKAKLRAWLHAPCTSSIVLPSSAWDR